MNAVLPCLHICISKDQAEFRVKMASFFEDSFSSSTLYFRSWYPWRFAVMILELGLKTFIPLLTYFVTLLSELIRRGKLLQTVYLKSFFFPCEFGSVSVTTLVSTWCWVSPNAFFSLEMKHEWVPGELCWLRMAMVMWTLVIFQQLKV